MKKLFILFIALILSVPALNAQSMSVAFFSLDDKDLTANQQGTIVYDQNGEKCALIKVKTTQQGFVFDVGSLGVQKTEQKVAEIWVYVPHGARRIYISHQQLGQLNYDFPVTLAKAKTYVLQLTSDEVQTVVKKAVTAQYVMFKLNPANAVVELNGEILETADGVATKRLPFGTYNYKVQAPRHTAQTGSVIVDDPKNKHIIDINLTALFSTFTFEVKNNAEIWIDGQKKGNGTCKVELGYGPCLIETKLAGHRNGQVDVNLTKELASKTIQLEAPKPIYGSLDINSIPADADVWIDGTKVGTTPMFIDEALVGSHKVKIKKTGYKDYTLDVTVKEGETEDVRSTLEKGTVAEERVFTVKGVSFKMKLVEAGTFGMGSTTGYENEKPVHNVTISMPFYIGDTEVTQALWKAVMGDSCISSGTSWSANYGLGDNYPAYNISYEDVLSFITKLNSMTGELFRMPTEAEWEYAAKGGNKSKGYTYSGSNTIGDVAWYTENSGSKSHAVKTKSANELGIYDMSGNVWEWCSDWYGSYSRSAVTEPTGPSSGYCRVSRGGGWHGSATYCRSAYRYFYSPSSRYVSLGMRLALSSSQK